MKFFFRTASRRTAFFALALYGVGVATLLGATGWFFGSGQPVLGLVCGVVAVVLIVGSFYTGDL